MSKTTLRRLVLLFGGQSAEHKISCISARHVLAAVDLERYAVEPIGITQSGNWVRAEEAELLIAHKEAVWPDQLNARGPEIDPFDCVRSDSASPLPVVFPVLHGPQGEDGTVQGLLELLDVPYIGSGVLSSALCMDKAKSKEILANSGVNQAKWRLINTSDLGTTAAHKFIRNLGLPLFVKPANMGSSVGVSRVDKTEELDRALELAATYDEWIIVEEAIIGRDIECGVLGNAAPIASVAGEILPGATWYDYDDKYAGGAKLLVPAPLDAGQLKDMQRIALTSYRALRCEGLARVDFFYESEGRGWLLNEINTMPGFTPISMFPKLWQESGLAYTDLIDRLVDLSIERYERRIGYRCINY